MNWAIKRHLYRDENPIGLIPKKKEPRGKAADILNAAQIKKIRLIINGNRDLADAFSVALETGMRIQEIENQQWDDFDIERTITRVRAHDDGWSPKDYEARIVPLSPSVVKIYKRRLKFKDLSPFVFCNEKGAKHGNDWVVAMGRAMRRAGIKHGGWHRTRHTFCTVAAGNGMDLEELRRVTGHSDVKTLRKYLHASDDYAERVRKLMPRF